MDKQNISNNDETKIALMANDISYIRESIKRIESSQTDFAKNYVTQIEFRPIRQLVYGLVTIILGAVIAAMVAVVVVHK